MTIREAVDRIPEALDHPSIRWLLGGALVLGLITAIVAIPKYQVGADLAAGIIQIADIPGQVDDYRKTVIQVVGGVVVIVGLYLTWRRIQVTEDGQVTERFTKAIEQLGDGRISVRLGGIYALERIAKDATQDHPTVVEVLSAFIRERTRVKLFARSHTEEDVVEGQGEAVGPETDVQAALTVLGRRVVKNDIPGLRVDLQGAHLVKADLSGANLTGADLSRAFLIGANLSRAFLIGANLIGADLTGAIFEEAKGVPDALLRSTAPSTPDEELPSPES